MRTFNFSKRAHNCQPCRLTNKRDLGLEKLRHKIMKLIIKTFHTNWLQVGYVFVSNVRWPRNYCKLRLQFDPIQSVTLLIGCCFYERVQSNCFSVLIVVLVRLKRDKAN